MSSVPRATRGRAPFAVENISVVDAHKHDPARRKPFAPVIHGTQAIAACKWRLMREARSACTAWLATAMVDEQQILS
eukprot:CAMPEP_0179481714 /NCGR_PEP_ID=MMETSP0799-20121207/59377_1 /TAXON_ID=46947 /ORGANISM="Geminigera cryophila, Strain CCMP2564" /LENGTH=76 /DNA_ID=CAMNT_0021294467 /DNA_START=109 /DNA_END=336 /DNA_ORIENTATION=+